MYTSNKTLQQQYHQTKTDTEIHFKLIKDNWDSINDHRVENGKIM